VCDTDNKAIVKVYCGTELLICEAKNKRS